jgi:DNA-binding NarL/FixJ family response regulator
MRPAKIVVVDDDADFRQLLVTLVQLDPRLRVAGQAGDGEAALEIVRREAPTIVLMDLMMPGLDGLEATRHIKRVLPEIKVIMLSSVADQQHRRLAHDSGADVFVDKRDMVTTLLATIRSLVAGGPVGPER